MGFAIFLAFVTWNLESLANSLYYISGGEHNEEGFYPY